MSDFKAHKVCNGIGSSYVLGYVGQIDDHAVVALPRGSAEIYGEEFAFEFQGQLEVHFDAEDNMVWRGSGDDVIHKPTSITLEDGTEVTAYIFVYDYSPFAFVVKDLTTETSGMAWSHPNYVERCGLDPALNHAVTLEEHEAWLGRMQIRFPKAFPKNN